MSLDIHEVLADGGLLNKSLPGFESRCEQIEMAKAVAESLNGQRHLVVEAGTGVGKSFAYLIPAIDLATTGGGKVLISTFTITLQEQLINKDLPFLGEALGRGFTAVLAKGRGNYLCRRRLEYALRKNRGLLDEIGSAFLAVNEWAGQTKDGSLSDIGFLPKPAVWDAVNSEHGNCRGRRCPYFQDCFYWRARRKQEVADIIVANHALMFSDLMLKEQGASLLPDYKHLIIDEAHNIEHVAEDHFGINISNYKVRFLLNSLYNPRTHKGLLAFSKAEAAIETVIQTGKRADKFFKNARQWYAESREENNGRCVKNFIEDSLSGHLGKLRSQLSKLLKQAEDEDEKFEIARFADRCGSLIEDLDIFLEQKRNEYVYWAEASEGRKTAVCLRSAPVNVGDDLKKYLFDRYKSIVMTSATLSCGGQNEKKGFEFFTGRIGLIDFDALRLGSPFDYQNQVTIYIEKDMPNPNDSAFSETATEVLKKYILQTMGRAFVLFTSYSMLDGFAEKLKPWLIANNIELLQQGTGVDRGLLLKQFKADNGSVLFGTESFWQGVDVPGQALSNVIIVRLPFAVPNQPLLAGRLEQIKNEGGNPFMEYQLPSAVIKFKQGFGRLIRSKSDKGIVVILDSRIANKRYGKQFLAALPRCKTELVGAERK